MRFSDKTTDLHFLCAASYAPPQRPPVVNPYAAGQTCPNGQPPPVPPPASPCNASVCSQPCGRYPTSQCVADACDGCKAKYNLNVSGPSFSVFRVETDAVRWFSCGVRGSLENALGFLECLLPGYQLRFMILNQEAGSLVGVLKGFWNAWYVI
jgi:hypothetical protein